MICFYNKNILRDGYNMIAKLNITSDIITLVALRFFCR